MFTTTRYILLTALRDWLFIALFIAILAAIGVASFLGGTAVSEQQQMMTAYIAGASRLILLTGIIIFVCFHVRRSFENREIELILSRPISRHSFIFSYWLGFSVLSSLIIIPVSLVIYLIAAPDEIGLLLFGLSLILESLVMVAFALFISLILKSAVSSVLGCFGFYFLCRIMGFFLILIENSNFKIISPDWLMQKMLFVLSIAIPRLDLFGQTKWLIYGADNTSHWQLFIMQSFIYIPLLLLMAISDFNRKQF